MARRVSGRPTCAVEAKTRRLVHSASSRPPPKAVLLTAEMVGRGSVASLVKVFRSFARNSLTSSWLMSSLSFKSAPAQNASSASLDKIKARVLPCPFSACKPSTTPLSSFSSCLEMALRALGLFSDRTVMLPACGAGMLEILIAEPSEVA